MRIVEGRKKAYPTILNVGALEGDCFSVSLDNGHTILLELADETERFPFNELIKRELFDKPQTDGTRLFWQDGTSLSIEQIFELLGSRDSRQL